jgi:hypothetical protein
MQWKCTRSGIIEEEKTLSPAQHWQVATTHNKL